MYTTAADKTNFKSHNTRLRRKNKTENIITPQLSAPKFNKALQK